MRERERESIQKSANVKYLPNSRGEENVAFRAMLNIRVRILKDISHLCSRTVSPGKRPRPPMTRIARRACNASLVPENGKNLMHLTSFAYNVNELARVIVRAASRIESVLSSSYGPMVIS